MTKYDKLIDAIKEQLYHQYNHGEKGSAWDEDLAADSAHEILLIVEEYQSLNNYKQWRASD